METVVRTPLQGASPCPLHSNLSRRVIEMVATVAVFECLECGHHAVYTDESKLNHCPECGDVHTDVTYGLELINDPPAQLHVPST